nr:reverse transcriptase domain-containing protein [Tanacetum cinerariifolium]
MNQAAIWQLIDDRVAAALEAQAANMANINNTNRNPEPREAHVARKCSYKEFMSCQTFNFKDYEKMIEAFIGRLPQNIEGNVTSSKPQNLKEAINISQRLMDQWTQPDLTSDELVIIEMAKDAMCCGDAYRSRLVISAWR